jgi:hypothetical protein
LVCGSTRIEGIIRCKTVCVSIPYKWNSWGLKSGGELFSTAKGTIRNMALDIKALKYAWFDDNDKLKFHKNMSDKIQLEKMQQKMAKKNRKNDKS